MLLFVVVLIPISFTDPKNKQAMFCLSLVVGALSVPELPPAYSLILKWNRPGGYEYIHQEAVDLTNQKFADSTLVNNTITERTILLPDKTHGGTGLSYIYDTREKTCVETDISGEKVSGPIRTFPDMKNETTEVVQGILCDKWTKDLGSYNVAVWFTHDGNVPVQTYNSDDEAKGAIVKGIKEIRCYFPGVEWDSFAIPAACKQSDRYNTAKEVVLRDVPTVPPKIPNKVQYKISWTSEIQGRTYQYAHFQYYDIDNQMHRDNQLENSCNIVATTLELPDSAHEAFHYDDKTLDCETYPFTARINQFIQVYPDMVYEKTETVDGLLCNKWTKKFPISKNQTEPYEVAVWFTTDGLTPVRTFSSIDNETHAATDGYRRISYYSTNVTKSDFTIPDGCKNTTKSD